MSPVLLMTMMMAALPGTIHYIECRPLLADEVLTGINTNNSTSNDNSTAITTTTTTTSNVTTDTPLAKANYTSRDHTRPTDTYFEVSSATSDDSFSKKSIINYMVTDSALYYGMSQETECCHGDYRQTATGCYKVSEVKRDWFEAAEECESEAAILTTVDSLEEMESLVGLIPSSCSYPEVDNYVMAWTGLNDVFRSDNEDFEYWRNADGSEVTFHDGWVPGHPEQKTAAQMKHSLQKYYGDCVGIVSDVSAYHFRGKIDMMCPMEACYICKKTECSAPEPSATVPPCQRLRALLEKHNIVSALPPRDDHIFPFVYSTPQEPLDPTEVFGPHREHQDTLDTRPDTSQSVRNVSKAANTYADDTLLWRGERGLYT